MDPIRSVYNGTESACYLESKIWEQIPVEIKNKDSLDVLRKKLKNGNLLSVYVEFVSVTNLSFV